MLEPPLVLPGNWTTLASTAVLGCTLLASPPALANWADEIDRNPAEEPEDADEPAEVVPEAPVVPTVPRLRFNDRPFNLQLRMGGATTVGIFGVVAEYDLLDRVNVGVGLGTNISGFMPGAHLRLRPIVSRNVSGVAVHAVFTELGVSRGNYFGSLHDMSAGLCDLCDEQIFRTKIVWWGQVEVGWEVRWVNGMLLRASTGIAVVVAEPAWQCRTRSGDSIPCSDVPPSGWAEVYTFAVGYAF